ncbi:HNH endonuclease signature motif containing protein [Brachybacterium sp. FME24]|uniref:HNH endonuclease signature motif containing protein n=1 Tax=Brachybacterium sp. FME24 TaxID=2742605 RepID=UPI001869549C|nr:HNH endonuclease signature motif containing protein [Brachybacterium sp. FME24]
MGEFDDNSEPLLLAPPSPEAAAAMKQAAARRRRRRPVTREGVRQVGMIRSPQAAQKLAELWDGGKQDSRRLAERHHVVIATSQDPLGPEVDKDGTAMEALHVSLALRCTRAQASSTIRESHRIGALLPRCLERLGRGEFPAAWFEKLVERTSDLEDDAVLEVDSALAEWDLSVSPESFSLRLGHLLTAVASRSEVPQHATPEARRRVVLDPPRPDGTGCLRIIGPIPEILDLSRRLDLAAHAVKNAQLSALEAGTPIPADADGYIERTGEVPSIAGTRYDVLKGTAFDTAGVEVPEARFRLNVTVPVMTLLGESDAPGMLDGTTPIPASMARDLAGRESTWYRVLTDPTSGRFLPVPADRYRPPAEQIEHLRLRHPTCAVPGCNRPTSWLTESDHIKEFDHEDPASGGPTDVVNLHELCREHHRLKTLGLLDPVRDDAAGKTWWDVSEILMTMQEDGRDLATEQVVAEMTAVWDSYETARAMREETAQRWRELREQGLAPGDEVTGPDGEDGWWVDEDGRLRPPPDPPPF